MSLFLSVTNLFFDYQRAVEPLFEALSVQFPPGWSGVVGANGSGKSTLLKLLANQLSASRGEIRASSPPVYCPQEVGDAPENAAAFFRSYDAFAFRLRDRLGLDAKMIDRWTTLSQGECKKLQIACALFDRPEILLIDEPTNHLDEAGRHLLLRELGEFNGVGVLVSHDRELLDTLCDQCLFLEPDRAVMRSGGVSAGQHQARLELENLLDRQQQLKKEFKRSKQELQRRREKEQQARNQDCKKKLDRHDHDGKGRIDAARVTGRDRRQGDLASRQRCAVARTETQLAGLGKVKMPEYGLKIPYGSHSKRDTLLASPERTIPLGPDRTLTIPPLRIERCDRIGLTGDNGSGKSTFLRALLPELKLDPGEYLYMPQEFSASMLDELFHTVQALPRGEFSQVMNVVASLGSRPERVLDSARCSPGEWRKLFFGLGVLRKVNLIVMDEPTNHLDLPSIECLERALNECQSALLLISHDRVFLKKTCGIHWHIQLAAPQQACLIKLGDAPAAACQPQDGQFQ